MVGVTTVHGGIFEVRDAAEYGVTDAGMDFNLNQGANLISTASRTGVTNLVNGDIFVLGEGSGISIENATTLRINNMDLNIGGAMSVTFVMSENSTNGLGLLSIANTPGGLDFSSSVLKIDVSLLNLGDAFWKSDWEANIISVDLGGLGGATFNSIETDAIGGTFSTIVENRAVKLIWTATPVPEPSTYAMIFGLVSCAGMLVRRRRK